MLLANIKDQCKRKRQGKDIFPCKTGDDFLVPRRVNSSKFKFLQVKNTTV